MCSGFFVSSLFAQNLKVTGKVTSQADGATLPGVSITVKGTAIGTTSDIDGNYSIDVPQGAVLLFSFVGMVSEEITISASGVHNVELMPDLIVMQEVVVTALGIKREKKSLGYAIQEVSGDALLEAKETNIANSLTGKWIAGGSIQQCTCRIIKMLSAIVRSLAIISRSLCGWYAAAQLTVHRTTITGILHWIWVAVLPT